jgi:Ca2+-binding RTX toxin-like protein
MANIINGTDLDDILNGTGLEDEIHGKKGNDAINGFGGDDTLLGDDDNDSLDGGAGNNTLRGGFGSDTYFVHSAGDVIFEAFDNVQDFVISDAPSYKLPSSPVDQLFVRGFSNGGSISGLGNQFNNFITGQFGVEHGVGSFALFGFGGDDFIQGDRDVKNTIFGGAGNDQLFGGTKDDFISGVDQLGFGSDLGTDDVDLIDISAENPTNGDKGHDTVRLGDSRGAYYSGSGFARIQGISDFLDTLILAGSRNDYIGKLTPSSNSDPEQDVTIFRKTSTGEDKIAVLESFDGVVLRSQEQIDRFLNERATYVPIDQPVKVGTNGTNVIRGSNANGILDGKGGDDKLFAKGGADIVLGGTGNDMLDGGTGDDLLRGGKGTDWLVGGTGVDTFVLAKGEGVDVIKGWQQGIDRIGFVGDVSSADLSFVAAKGGTLVKSGNESLALLQGVKPGSVSFNDIVQIGTTQLSGMNVPTILG